MLRDVQELLGEVGFLAGSRVRARILLELLEGRKSSSELKESIRAPASTIAHSLWELESKNLVERVSESCVLTSKGRLMGAVLLRFIGSFDSIRVHRDFWNDHSIKSIPDDLLMNINVFRRAKVIEATLEDLHRPHASYHEMLDSTGHLKALLAVCFPRHIRAIKELLAREASVEVILTPEAYREFIRDFGLSEVKNNIERGSLSLRIINGKQELSYMLSDNFFSMELFNETGAYDPRWIIIGHEREILDWGKRLFDHHRGMSSRINVDDIMAGDLTMDEKEGLTAPDEVPEG